MTEIRKKFTHIALVIDKSGSMLGVRDVTLRGINEQLQRYRQEQRDVPKDRHEITMSVLLFNSKVDTLFSATPADQTVDLSDVMYQPTGSTALLDALLAGAKGMMRDIKDNEDSSYLVVGHTDGEENASRPAAREELKALITQLEATGRWTFTLIGANINLARLVDATGIQAGNMRSYVPTLGGTAEAFSASAGAGANFVSARSAGQHLNSVRNFYTDPGQGGDPHTAEEYTPEKKRKKAHGTPVDDKGTGASDPGDAGKTK